MFRFSIFYRGCKQFKSFHFILNMVAKVIIKVKPNLFYKLKYTIQKENVRLRIGFFICNGKPNHLVCVYNTTIVCKQENETNHYQFRLLIMTEEKLNGRKRAGFILLGIVILCWIAVPVLPFFDFRNKIIIITSILIAGEALFIISVALLGKAYWKKIKTMFKKWFSFKKKQINDYTNDK